MKHEQTITIKLKANAKGDGMQVEMSFDPALPTQDTDALTIPVPRLHLIAMAAAAAKAAMNELRTGEGQ